MKKNCPYLPVFLLAFLMLGVDFLAAQSESKNVATKTASTLTSVPYSKIGKVTPRSALQVESSDWSIGCEVLDRDLAIYDSYKKYLGSLGVKHARLQAGWAKTEKSPGVYDWKWLDVIVTDMLKQGVQPWIELSYGNPIYPGGGGPTLGDGLPRSEAALTAWHAWSRALVERYKDRVSTWAVWNEPDVTKEVPAAEYAALYIRTAEMIRSLQPNATIYALSLAYHMPYAEAFLKSVAEQRKLDVLNTISLHGYPENPDNLQNFEKLGALTAQYAPKVKLIQGETGAPSGKTQGALGKVAWTELTQAKWDLRRMLIHHGNGIRMNLFTLSEFIYNDPRRQGMNSKGLLAINPDKTVSRPKPAYFAAQNVYSIFDSSLVLDKKITAIGSDPRPVTAFGWRKKSTQAPVLAVWFGDKPATESNELTPVDLTIRDVRFKQPVYVDLRTGEVSKIPADAWSRVGNDTIFRSVPVYDSPILIAEQSTFHFN